LPPTTDHPPTRKSGTSDAPRGHGYHGDVSHPTSLAAPPARWISPVLLGALLATGHVPAQEGHAPASRPQAGQSTKESVRSLLQLPEETLTIESWMKHAGWKSKRNSPKRFSVGAGTLHMVSVKDSVMIGTERGFPLDPQRFSRIRFTIRVDQNPPGMDLHRKSGEDASFRLFVAFDRGGGLFRPPNSVAYAWVEKDWRKPDEKNGNPDDKDGKSPAEPADAVIKSAHFGNVRFIPIGYGTTRAAPKGQPGGEPNRPAKSEPVFVTIERDLLADYRRAFPDHRGPVPMLRGVMLKCDSNNTKTRAEAWISRLELIEVGKSR